ncbi:MAG: hypothetical protein K8I60_18915 [Anaerolineae bacterium]|nr:hypothetical protein [Anaerolineae bacterium]
MSQEILVEARQLIDEKRFVEARTILNNSQHPAAPYWLKKLDVLSPDTREVPVVRLVEEPTQPALSINDLVMKRQMAILGIMSVMLLLTFILALYGALT